MWSFNDNIKKKENLLRNIMGSSRKRDSRVITVKNIVYFYNLA